MNPIAWWLAGHEYLLYQGNFGERLIAVSVIAVPIILWAIFSVRHNKGVRNG